MPDWQPTIYTNNQGTLYYVKHGFLYRNHVPIERTVFGSVPATNVDFGEEQAIHRKFGGPRLAADRTICDFVEGQLMEEGILIAMSRKYRDGYWERTAQGIRILNTEHRDPEFGFLLAYMMVTLPLVLKSPAVVSRDEDIATEDVFVGASFAAKPF